MARRSLRNLYAPYVRSLPEIARFASRLDGLVANGTAGLRSSEIFETDLHTARTAVASRVAIAQRPQPQPSHCPVCEQDVEGWIARPHAGLIDLKVMDDIGVVGTVGGRRVVVGGPRLFEAEGIDFSPVREENENRKAEHDLHKAEGRANRAEEDARFAIDFAYSAIVEAEYATLDAMLARENAAQLAASSS